jgi:AraC-like DNA-binding protein
MPAPAAIFRTYPACPELRPYICGYMTLTIEGAEPARTTLRSFADGSHESRFRSADPLLTCMPPAAHQGIAFNFGDPWRIRSGSLERLMRRTSWVSGATTERGTFDVPRHAETLDVLFNSGVAHNFFGVPADALTDEVVGLDDLWGASARRLTAQLAELRTFAERIRVLEAELLRRLRRLRWMDTSLQPVTRLIERERGAVSVEWLSRASGISRQHLARKFRAQVGVTPKQFCRYVRFHALLTHAYTTPQADWAALAAEFGYYDQPHLIAEFREFTGYTPGEFFIPPAVESPLAAD